MRYSIETAAEEEAREDVLAVADEVTERLRFMERIEAQAILTHATAVRHLHKIAMRLPADAMHLIDAANKELDHELEVLLRETGHCLADTKDIQGFHVVLAKHGDPSIQQAYRHEIERQAIRRRARRLIGATHLQVIG